LPSSLAGVLPRALGSSPRLPVSVSVRAQTSSLAAFPGSRIRPLRYWTSLAIAPRAPVRWPCPRTPAAGLDGPLHPPAAPIRLRPRLAPNGRLWYRNLHRLSIAYAFRPRLRSRLTLGGRSFPRNPPACGDMDSHHASRYSCRHSLFRPLHRASRCGFPAGRNAPLPPPPSRRTVRSFGGGLSPVHCRRKGTRPVSYYALFQCWLLLSQHPGCLRAPTSFAT
jgi:hypothetical protein